MTGVGACTCAACADLVALVWCLSCVEQKVGNTPLHFCFSYGYGDTLGEYLISKGADCTIRNNDGFTCREGIIQTPRR